MADNVNFDALAAALLAVRRKNARNFKTIGAPLRAPGAREAAARALADCLGPPAENLQLRLTFWRGGAGHVGPVDDKTKNQLPGVSVDATLAELTELLRERAHHVADKGRGWVVEPTDNPEGLRTNAATRAVTALFLDCDATGSPDALLDAVSRIGLACAVYQSGGWTPETPKWRAVVPLSEPFPVPDEAAQKTWKGVYLLCRVIFGALGGLDREGFDSKTDAVACPWYLSERRRPEDPPRRIAIWNGRSLALGALVGALGHLLPDEAPARGAERHKVDLDDVAPPMTEERREEVVARIAAATASIPSGRRDLYLALPGVLLDRGVSPDDVIDICAEISARYPRPDDKRHADNVRSATCTVKKWEAGEEYTRIGTLQEQHPDVAAAVDAAVPDPVGEEIAAAMKRLKSTPPIPTLPSASTAAGTPPPPKRPIAPGVRVLVRRLEKIATDRREEGSTERTRAAGTALGFILAGRINEISHPKILGDAIEIVGFDYPDVDPDKVAVLVRDTTPTEIPGSTMIAIVEAIHRGRARRARWDANESERQAKHRAELLSREITEKAEDAARQAVVRHKLGLR